MTAIDLASNQLKEIFPSVRESTVIETNPLYRNRTNHRTMVEKMLHLPSVALQSKESKNSDKDKDKKKEKDKMTTRQKNIFKIYQFMKEKAVTEIITLSSFKFYKRIGEGAFGEVYLVKKDGKDKFYALKAIRKERVFGTNLYRYIQTEK